MGDGQANVRSASATSRCPASSLWMMRLSSVLPATRRPPATSLVLQVYQKEYRSMGIGAALLLKCLLSMREMGYGYAIIGGVEEAEDFYRKIAGAVPIPDSFPGVYRQVVGIERVMVNKRQEG